MLSMSLTLTLTQPPTPSINPSEFFQKLPNPLKATSQEKALKTLSVSRKIRDLVKVLSIEDLAKITKLTTEKMNILLKKSEQIEQKLIEGTG
jgi:hypothetical protein